MRWEKLKNSLLKVWNNSEKVEIKLFEPLETLFCIPGILVYLGAWMLFSRLFTIIWIKFRSDTLCTLSISQHIFSVFYIHLLAFRRTWLAIHETEEGSNSIFVWWWWSLGPTNPFWGGTYFNLFYAQNIRHNKAKSKNISVL